LNEQMQGKRPDEGAIVRRFSLAGTFAPERGVFVEFPPRTMFAGMCNDYEQHVAWAEYRKVMQQLDLGIPTQQSELDLPRTDDIRVNDRGPVMRAAGNVVELVPMTFGFPSASSRRGPVFNFKSEGRRFDRSNRCLIPASAFFEFTGKRYPRAKHRFTLVGAPSWQSPGFGARPKAAEHRRSPC
jgi:hypothetical protein